MQPKPMHAYSGGLPIKFAGIYSYLGHKPMHVYSKVQYLEPSGACSQKSVLYLEMQPKCA